MTAARTDAVTGLLAVLLDADGWATHDTIARRSGLKAAQVNALLAALADEGCDLEQQPGAGVRLNRTTLSRWADYLERRHADRLGRAVHVYRQTDSTQDIARRMVDGARDHAALHGTLIVADHQTAGRGRLGRRWHSRPGDQLLFTLAVAHRDERIDRLMLAAALGVAEAVESLLGRRVGLRWPNDLLVDGRKLAGMLIERADGVALLGVGINVAADPTALPADLATPPTSFAHLGHHVDRLALLDRVLDRLDRWLVQTDSRTLTDAWRRRSTLDQQRITVETDGRRLTGRVIDIDPSRGLLLEVERGPVVPLPAATTSIVFNDE